MATLTVSSGLSGTNGYLIVNEEYGGQSIDWTGEGEAGNTQTIGFAAHEALEVHSDFGTPGWAIFRNLDDTNFVQIGRDQGGTFVPFARLFPGEHFPVPLDSDAVYAKADTAPVRLRYKMLER